MPKLEIAIPKAFMQGLIALLLIGNFTFMLIAPTIFPQSYKAPGDALTQTLVNLVILAVGYYLGSSQGSARKDELNAQQQDKAITMLATAPSPAPAPVDPIAPAPAPVPVVIDDTKPVDVAVVPKK